MFTPHASLKLLYNDARLATIWQALDELHNAASEGDVRGVCPLSDPELIGWLNEIIFTAQEIKEELMSHDTCDGGIRLELMRKSR